jgi:LysM domain
MLLLEKAMNASNPFQIPSCLQKVDFQQRRRERFKNGFIAAVAVLVVLLVGLLIEGCKTDQATSSAAAPSVGVTQPQTQPLVADQRLNPAPQPNVNPVVRPVAPISQPPTLYVVKSGDTLSRIAKAHGTTIKALKSVNGLASDRIVVGAKLKIPTA